MNPVKNHRMVDVRSTNKYSARLFYNGMNRRGFTIVELIIVITIMAILLTLGVVNMRSSQVNGRDSERKIDIETLASHLESYYAAGHNDEPFSAIGGTKTTVDGYTVHTFTASGTFTPNSAGSVEVLVVAGGGGGASGGGGGGGVITSTISLDDQPYSVTVGDGGYGGYANKAWSTATNGKNSTFSTLTAVGGGGGAQNDLATSAGSGGSGGGGGATSTVQSNGGAGTDGQGFAGGTVTSAYFASPFPSAGGGGAGAAGSNPTGASISGNGGAGKISSVNGLTYGGGGGGATWSGGTVGIGGSGGGGNGGWPNGVAGTTNSGGGGGGGSNSGAGIGGIGGSGIVIIRYITPLGIGSYPSTAHILDIPTIKTTLRDIDLKSATAPGAIDGEGSSLIAATDNTILTTVSTLPHIYDYVYQPLKSDGNLCTLVTEECVKFNLYYRLESDNSVNYVKSKNQ